MGVYINMEMPTSCGECKFFAWKRGVGQHCAVDDRITFHATLNGFDVGYERNGNCPLVPVPAHGDLIDRDALLDTATIHWSQTTNESCFPIDEIEYAPIIIPADGKDIKVPTREECE